MRNSCFWAVTSLTSAVIAAVFLVLFIFGIITVANVSIGIWIAAAVAAIALIALLLRTPKPAGFGSEGAAPVQPACRLISYCYARRIGTIAGAAASIGFGAAFLSTAMTAASVAALVFYFLAVMAFAFLLITLVGYAACRLR